MILLMLMSLSMATDVGNTEVIRELSTGEPPQSVFNRQPTKPRAHGPRAISPQVAPTLQVEGYSRRDEETSKSSLVVRPRGDVASHDIAVYPGDVFPCQINQSIIGYVGSVSPVNAEILDGPYKGHFFVGNATMDPKTKNVVIQFHLLRSKNGHAITRLKASVQSTGGELGLEGTVSSYYWQYFFASVLASTAEGYAQATVQRQRNVFGDYQNVPTTETATKSGIAGGASQTAEVMAENMKSDPEYTTVHGPIRTRVFVMDNKIN